MASVFNYLPCLDYKAHVHDPADGGKTLREAGKKYVPYALEWCVECGALRIVHGEHKGKWDLPSRDRSAGMRSTMSCYHRRLPRRK